MSSAPSTADEIAAIADVDEILNYVLFALLGVLVVRDTGIMYAGAVAGFVRLAAGCDRGQSRPR